MKTNLIFLFLFLFIQLKLFAQKSLEHGYHLPTKTHPFGTTNGVPLRVLLVPVELHGGNCDAQNPSCIPAGQTPTDIDEYFDATLPTTGPTKFFTKLLFQASFGQLVVLGDFLDQPVHVNYCPTTYPLGVSDWTSVINPEIHAQFPTLPLHHSTPLSDFDAYDLDDHHISGVLKTSGGNSKFDCVIYLIRNFDLYGGEIGFGLSINSSSTGVTTGFGTDLATAFGHHGSITSIKFIMTEFFHGLFGHNNWHGGAGAGNHTFFCPTPQWGLESQGGMSQVVSGYDRWIFNWTNPPDKLISISARDALNAEIPSELTIPSTPTTSTFVLEILLAREML